MSDHLWSTIFSVIVYWRLLFNPSFTVSGVGESGYILWRYILQYLLVVCIGCHEKHDYANYDQFAQKFEIGLQDHTACLCTKFEVIWINENRVMGQRSSRIFCYVIWENGLVGILLPTNMAAAI